MIKSLLVLCIITGILNQLDVSYSGFNVCTNKSSYNYVSISRPSCIISTTGSLRYSCDPTQRIVSSYYKPNCQEDSGYVLVAYNACNSLSGFDTCESTLNATGILVSFYQDSTCTTESSRFSVYKSNVCSQYYTNQYVFYECDGVKVTAKYYNNSQCSGVPLQNSDSVSSVSTTCSPWRGYGTGAYSKLIGCNVNYNYKPDVSTSTRSSSSEKNRDFIKTFVIVLLLGLYL
jgi:membrane-bound inhibitor of C-type lysozyme